MFRPDSTLLARHSLHQIYHKLCLKCNSCGKRLDPGGLVQHDEQVSVCCGTS